MGYVPKFIHFSHFIEIMYPFGVYFGVMSIYKVVQRLSIILMIAGAIVNELHHINSSANTCILIVRKDNDTSAHCHSLRGIEDLQEARFIIVDDFIQSGETIKAILKDLDEYFEISSTPKEKYDMLCISNYLDVGALKKNRCANYKK